MGAPMTKLSEHEHFVPLRYPRRKPGAAVVRDSRVFVKTKFPARDPLVVNAKNDTPIFTKYSINEIFATRGTGKSMLAMALAGKHSSGGEFLNWNVVQPTSVLYVDGELPNSQIQDRMLLLHSPDTHFRLITLDDHPSGLPNLAEEAGQKWLEGALVGIEVLILDSIASLAPFATNDEQRWIPFIVWLQKLRSRGLCIHLLHQAGKAGLQRGHSRGDDPLDVQIKLKTTNEELDYLNFDLTYEKFRGERSGVQPIAVKFVDGRWECEPLKADKYRLLTDYLKEHPNKEQQSFRKIARALPELGSYVTVRTLMRKLEKQLKSR
jgi:hypothetical protein